MKRELTPIEKILFDTYNMWKDGDIKNCDLLGYESNMILIPQYELKSKKYIYYIDFVEPFTKLAIELDGFNFHYLNQEQVVHDKKRERKIIMEDFTILRYPGTEVHNNPVEVLEEIYHTYCLRAIKITDPETFKDRIEGRFNG